jgi:hypothetical protein
MTISSRGFRAPIACSLLILVLGACSSTKTVANPFHDGVVGGRVVVDDLACGNPAPNFCERDIVIRPTGRTSQAELLGSVSARLGRNHGWTRGDGSPYRGQGLAFNASNPNIGAYVLAAPAQHGVNRKVVTAARRFPQAVVVHYLDNR